MVKLENLKKAKEIIQLYYRSTAIKIDDSNYELVNNNESIIDELNLATKLAYTDKIKYFQLEPTYGRTTRIHKFSGNFIKPTEYKMEIRGFIYKGLKDKLELVAVGNPKKLNARSTFFDYSIISDEYLKGEYYIKIIYNDTSVVKK